MGIHIESTAGAKRRVMWQRLVCGMGGVVIAVGMVGVAGSVLDRILIEPVPEYRPQFVMFEEEETTCGGMIVCPVRNPISRRPTPPAGFGIRPLGLAPSSAPDAPVGDVPDWEPDLGSWDPVTWD